MEDGTAAQNLRCMKRKFSFPFVKLVVIGGIIALPLTYQLTKIWLENYAYKMGFDTSLFLLPMAAVILLAVITISFQTLSAANTNPVQSMKYE